MITTTAIEDLAQAVADYHVRTGTPMTEASCARVMSEITEALAERVGADEVYRPLVNDLLARQTVLAV